MLRIASNAWLGFTAQPKVSQLILTAQLDIIVQTELISHNLVLKEHIQIIQSSKAHLNARSVMLESIVTTEE